MWKWYVIELHLFLMEVSYVSAVVCSDRGPSLHCVGISFLCKTLPFRSYLEYYLVIIIHYPQVEELCETIYCWKSVEIYICFVLENPLLESFRVLCSCLQHPLQEVILNFVWLFTVLTNLLKSLKLVLLSRCTNLIWIGCFRAPTCQK